MAGVFPPEESDSLRESLHQSPPELPGQGPAPARWTLAYMRKALPLLTDYTLSGIWRRLRSLGIRYRRGRQAVHSPDPDYESKRDQARHCVEQARQQPEQVVALYLDELSFYRQPSVAPCWWDEHWGSKQPLGRLSHRSNTLSRVVGALDATTGRVVAAQGAKIGVHKLCQFYAQLRAQYPQAGRIYLIQDNWPVHFLSPVVKAAQAARIEMVRLPTYAPWLNPIEKLWRKLKQEVLHMHRLSDQWDQLKQRVNHYLEALAQGSKPLLHYVGLLPELLPD